MPAGTSTPPAPLTSQQLPRRGMGCRGAGVPWGCASSAAPQERAPAGWEKPANTTLWLCHVWPPRKWATGVGEGPRRGATETYGGAGQTQVVPAQGAGCWDAGSAGALSKVLMVNGGQGRRQGCARGCRAVSQPRQVPECGCPWPMPYARLWRGSPVPVPGSHSPTEGQFRDPAADFTSHCP